MNATGTRTGTPRVLVVHASRHGATAGIAERIAHRLRAAGFEVDAVDVEDLDDADDIDAYDAFVVGGAIYLTRWLRSATRFVRRHEELLARRPVWLFASGPLGDDPVDDEGRDLHVVARPREFAGLSAAIEPEDTRVFFGRWDPSEPAVGLAERMLRLAPEAGDALPIGDFREWPAIDEWADGIAAALVPVRTDAAT